MARHQVQLSDPVSEMIEAQVASGRFKDVSAAMQEAAWNYFFGTASPFEEYQVTPEAVEKSATKDLARIQAARKEGGLKDWE